MCPVRNNAVSNIWQNVNTVTASQNIVTRANTVQDWSITTPSFKLSLVLSVIYFWYIEWGESNLDIGSTAWAAFAVLAEPVCTQGLIHRILDHLLPKALLHELLSLRGGRQVLVFEATKFIWSTKKYGFDQTGGRRMRKENKRERKREEMQTLPARNLHLERPW